MEWELRCVCVGGVRLGEIPNSLSRVSGGWCRSVAGRPRWGGDWRVLRAGEGHCWIHEAEEGVSGVSLHLSQNNTPLKHNLLNVIYNFDHTHLEPPDITGRKPTCLKKAWVSREDADGLRRERKSKHIIGIIINECALWLCMVSDRLSFTVLTCARAAAADTAGPGCAEWQSGF